MLKTGWGGGRTRTISPMKRIPLHPPHPLPLGVFLAPPPASHHRPVPRPTLVPLPPKSFASVPDPGLTGKRTQGDRVWGTPRGQTLSAWRAEPRGRDVGEGGRPLVGEGREEELDLAGLESPASRGGSAVSKAVLGADRGKPTLARSPPLFPPAASSPLRPAPPPQPPAVSALENLVGGRREEPPDLTPSPRRARDPCPPWTPPDPHSHLPLIFLCPSPPSLCPSLPSCLPPSLPISFFLSPPLGLIRGGWEGVRGCWGGKWGRLS